jgi:hypothetical protein
VFQILIAVLDSLDRFQLNRVVRVDKRIRELAQFILEHRKKIRLCGEDSRVLVLSLPSKYGNHIIWSDENTKPIDLQMPRRLNRRKLNPLM